MHLHSTYCILLFFRKKQLLQYQEKTPVQLKEMSSTIPAGCKLNVLLCACSLDRGMCMLYSVVSEDLVGVEHVKDFYKSK